MCPTHEILFLSSLYRNALAIWGHQEKDDNFEEPALKKIMHNLLAIPKPGEQTEVPKNDDDRHPCVICKKNDDRPMCHFVPTAGKKGSETEVHVHIFCGKIAAIASTNKMPEYEIVDTAAVRNKYGKTRHFATALKDTRSSTDRDSGKVYYLFKEIKEIIEEDGIGKAKFRPVQAPKKKSVPKPAAKKSNETNSTPRTPQQAVQGSPELVAVKSFQRRPCICKNPACYSLIERWVNVGDDMRCGYVSLPNWSPKKTERANVVNQFRELAFLNMQGDKKNAREDKGLRKYIAFHHFEVYMLLPGNRGLVEYVQPEVAASAKLPREYLITTGENRGNYLPSPRRVFSDIIRELDRLELLKRIAFAPTPPQPESVPNSDLKFLLDTVDIQRLNNRLDAIPQDYEGLKARYEHVERTLAIEIKRKGNIETELSNAKAELCRVQMDQARLKHMIQTLHSEAHKC